MTSARGMGMIACGLACLAGVAVSGCEGIAERIANHASEARHTFPRERKAFSSALVRVGDAHAPDCPPLPADTGRWRAVIMNTSLPDLPWVGIRVPFGYADHIVEPIIPDSLIEGGGWGRALGSWSIQRFAGGATVEPDARFHVWIGSMQRFPSIVVDRPSTQISALQCMTLLGGDTLHMIRFSLQPEDAEVRHYVSAYMPLEADTVFTGLGEAAEERRIDEMAAMLRTLHVFRRIR